MTTADSTAPTDAPQTYVFGPLSVTVDGIDLRDIRWCGIEAFRRIYPVFQDVNWTNRPFVVDDRTIEVSADQLILTATGTGSVDAEPLRWQVTATVTAGDVDYRFIASTDRPFARNRLGLCLLHPMSAAGARCEISHPDGSTSAGHFPVEISAHQPFLDINAIAHELRDGMWATAAFTGEVFEMEDHRNWSDASFKTYCTPISLPFPVTVAPGDVIDQSVRLSFPDLGGFVTPNEATPRVVTVAGDPTPLPRIGIGLTGQELPAGTALVQALRPLALDHCRIHIDAQDPTALTTVQEAAAVATAIGARLHVAVTCQTPADLTIFADLGSTTVSAIRRWMIVSSEDKVTPAGWAPAARDALGAALGTAELGGGTDLYFTELNREPPGPSDFDVTNFALTPQVHAFDDRTLVQNAMAQSVVAADAPRVCDGTLVSVAPITLRPRFNPNATDPEHDVSNTPLPSDVDARQRSWFTACWTASSIKHLSEPNTIDSLTYFETPGWKGILAGDTPSPDPIHFPTAPGEAFPVLTVFAALAGATTIHRCNSSDPESFDALVVSGPSWTRVVAINWSPETHHLHIEGAVSAEVDAAPRTVTIAELTTSERTP